MKGLLKFLAYAVGAFVVVIAGAAITVYVSSNAKLKKTHSIVVKPVSVPTDAAALARGKHLAATRGCADCHGADFAGKLVFENPAMGVVYAPNITRGEGGLPATFNDADFVRAIRHGVGREGRGLFLMPSIEYATFSDADLGALIAYVKSMPPVAKVTTPVALGPVARGLVATGKIRLAADVIDHPNVKPAVVTAGVTPEYGKYVAGICMGCHGDNLSGGKIAAGPPEWPPAANLTPHAQASVAKWTEADFVGALRTGKRPDGSAINEAMPRAFGGLDDTEVKAIWAYLRTVPAVATGVR